MSTNPTQRRRAPPPPPAGSHGSSIQLEEENGDDNHSYHHRQQHQQNHHQRRPPMMMRRRLQKRHYPRGSYDARLQQHRECICFGVIMTILCLILVYLISILLYMNASSISQIIQGVDIDFHDDKPILVIGGTDGSGTRAFVDTIKDLGAVIVADDPVTFDVHAAELFRKQGWPAFVNTVLKETHSANYSFETDLSQAAQDILEKEVMKFESTTNIKYDTEKKLYKKRTTMRRRREIFKSMFQFWKKRKNNYGNQDEHPDNYPGTQYHLASKISFAIKAPVSMLVLPVLSKLLNRRIKFLHVIREYVYL